MKMLIIDNYDSFTFNLFQLFAEVTGAPPLVARNDETSWEELSKLDVDAIVISPGPGRPEVARDFGVCRPAIDRFAGPILGVCLGHQGICHMFGGRVDYARVVMHGRTSQIYHDGSELFTGIPQGFEAVRYHSLIVSDPGDALTPSAWSDDGEIMAVRHGVRPIWGVQFHPESICTAYGRTLAKNFCKLARQTEWARRPRSIIADSRWRRGSPRTRAEPPNEHDGRRPQVFSRRLDCFLSPERCFQTLFGGARVSFWLDSSLEGHESARFSFMGDATGPLSEVVRYDVNRKSVVREVAAESVATSETIFDALKRWLSERRIAELDATPVPFTCGWVGYIGYEAKADCGASAAAKSDLPDAQLIFADRLIAFDHQQRFVWLLCYDYADMQSRAEAWFERMSELIRAAENVALLEPQVAKRLSFYPNKDDATYGELIRKAKEAIGRGETYEVCLTNEFVARGSPDPLEAYRQLRRASPAPHAAFLRFGEVSVLSSSPERFLRIDPKGSVESKPIKGTIGRGLTPQRDADLAEQLRTSVKDRSENLMIVDLLRNDIGRVSEIGSVHVPKLFGIETFATVHQLVSTIRGQLREELSPIDCVRAAFPGGSMTGAPKIRTMEIIDSLEERPRGIYSGTIGYFSLNGAVDLNIVIRTAVFSDGKVRVGAGGAIVALSDVEQEIAEVHLKCTGLMRALNSHIVEDLSPNPIERRAVPE